jgi:DNA-binding response OmpR family regulator
MNTRAPSGAGTILLVDDSTSKRYILASWLRRGGYELIEATTGAEALRRMKDTAVDLVVLDVQLPDMSGFAVCEQIKGDPAHASTPVVHVSAAAVEPEDRTQGLVRGADAYLVEPIDPDELLATVHAILRFYRGRQYAERLAARLSMLASITTTLNRSRTTAGLVNESVRAATTIFRAPAMVCVERMDGQWLLATVAGPTEEPVVTRQASAPAGLGGPGTPIEVRPARLGLAGWPDPGLVRVVTAAGRPNRNSVHVGVPADISDPGSPVLTLLAQAIAAAGETMRLYTVEHQLALTLQASLLPQRLPFVPGLDLARRYVPASETAEIGGDFYELMPLGDQFVIAVGDVGGHSLHAATIMAELRHAMRAYLAEGHSPGSVIQHLNTLVLRLPSEIATLCLIILDPVTGAARVANAGHPAPLLVHDGTVTQFVEHGALLGLAGSTAPEFEIEIPPGATVVLYTDGLVERRGEPISVGIGRLVEAAAQPEADLDAYCDRLLRDVGPETPGDDIALVVLRRHA